MTGRLYSMGWLSAVLVAAVLAAGFMPMCAMPACNDSGAGTCADFQPACDQCPDTVVMKHTPDDAVATNAPSTDVLVAVAQLAVSAEPVAAEPFLAVPDATASPPPLNPLGVRLTV